MLGLPDKNKVVAAFRAFEDRLADLKAETLASMQTPAGNDQIKSLRARIENLEKFIHDLRDAF